MLTDNLSPNVPKMSYFALKSSKIVSFWTLPAKISGSTLVYN